MATQSPDEFTRFTMTNLALKDANGNIDKSSLKDWQTQVDSMTKALNSATNSIINTITQVDEFGKAFATFDVPKSQNRNASRVFNQKLVDFETKYDYLAGSLAKDPYSLVSKESDYRKISFNKSFYGTQSKRTLKKTVGDLGGTVENNPTKTRKDQMSITFPVSESDWQDALLKTGGDEAKAKTSLSAKYTRKNLKLAEKYSNDVASENKEKQEQKEKDRKEKQEQKEKDRKERQDKQSTIKSLGKLSLVFKVLTTIADIARRILTATFSRASDVKREGLNAKSLGVTYNNLRHYSTLEGTMGLKEGAIISAIGSLQSAFGNITHLDENALAELSKVMGSGVINAINTGLGKNNPEALMENILDTYFKRGQKGINSIGQQVGQYQAERELATALEKAGFSDMAEILRNMFYTNDTGIYKDRVSGFASYSDLVKTYTNGLTLIDKKKAEELGQTIDGIKTRFNDLKKNLEEGLLISLEGLIYKIDNWDIGKSATEKMEDYKSNGELNQIAYDTLMPEAKVTKNLYTSMFKKAGISFEDLGIEGVSNVEEYLDFIAKGDVYIPKNESQKTAFNKLKNFLKTEEGKEAVKLVNLFYTVSKLAKKAKEANDTGRVSGKIEYDKNAYTEANIAKEAKDNFVEDSEDVLYRSTDNPATALAHLTNTFAQNSLFDDDDVFTEYENAFYDGKFTYEKVLASAKPTSILENVTKAGFGKGLTKDLLELAKKRDHKFKKGKKESEEDAVKRAMAQGIISDEDARHIAKENMYTFGGGYGMSKDAYTKSHESAQKRSTDEFEVSSGVYSTLAKVLQLKAVKNIEARLSEENAKNTVISVGGYDDKTSEVQVTITLIDEKGEQKQLYSGKSKSDVPIKEGVYFKYNFADVTSKANERGGY